MPHSHQILSCFLSGVDYSWFIDNDNKVYPDLYYAIPATVSWL